VQIHFIASTLFALCLASFGVKGKVERDDEGAMREREICISLRTHFLTWRHIFAHEKRKDNSVIFKKTLKCWSC